MPLRLTVTPSLPVLPGMYLTTSRRPMRAMIGFDSAVIVGLVGGGGSIGGGADPAGRASASASGVTIGDLDSVEGAIVARRGNAHLAAVRHRRRGAVQARGADRAHARVSTDHVVDPPGHVTAGQRPLRRAARAARCRPTRGKPLMPTVVSPLPLPTCIVTDWDGGAARELAAGLTGGVLEGVATVVRAGLGVDHVAGREPPVGVGGPVAGFTVPCSGCSVILY